MKRIRHYSLLSHNQMEELFTSLEKQCSGVSYFWVQYGLVFQLIGKFEDANNHFLYAKSIRPNSYQVAHALAKNQLEIALDDLKKGKVFADEAFLEGCRSMEEIIHHPKYSRAFSYSVHSYAVMLMKYYEEKKQIIPFDLCKDLNGYFNTLLNQQIDSETKNIIIRFYHYCERHNITQFCEGLDCIWNITPCITTYQDYLDL